MPNFKFQGFAEGAAVALSLTQGALSDAASVPSWGQGVNTSLTLTLSANRLTGTAPMGVLFAADSSSTAGAVESPFHDIYHTWDFDDPGTYDALRATALWGRDRNIAHGPETVHVFDTPGTYQVTCTARDGESVLSETVEIVVEDPDEVFSGSDTAVVSTTGDFTGAPAGASQHSSIDAALAALTGTNRRILLRAGEVFDDGVSFDLSSGSDRRLLVGRFGAGANPKIMQDQIRFRGSANSVAEAMVDRVDVEQDFDATDPNTPNFGGLRGIDFAGGNAAIRNAHKTVWGATLKNIRDIGITVDGMSGTPGLNFYCGNTFIDSWWNFAFFSGFGGEFGFCGCRFNHPPGTVNGRHDDKFNESTALHAAFRLSNVYGRTVLSNCDLNSFVSWASSTTSRSFQNMTRWNTATPDQKLVIERMQCEGGSVSILNLTPQARITDNFVLVDRVHHVHGEHSKFAIRAPMGGTTIRNYICVIPDNAPATSTGLIAMFTDSGETIPVIAGAQTRRSEFYSNALIDLRSDANARSRTGNQDRDFNPGGFGNIATSFFGNNILHAPNMFTGGTLEHAPLSTTPTYQPQGGGGERWESATPNLAMAYGDEVTALFRPAPGSGAIGAASGKVSLLDFDGRLRADVLAGLMRTGASIGPFEPDLES